MRYPIIWDTLYFGGILTSICTWSGHNSASIISTPFWSHSFLNIFPIERISVAARKVLDIIQKFTRALVLNQEEINSKDGIVNWDTSNIERISDAVKNLIRFFRGLAAAVDIAWMAISQPIKVIIKRIPFLNDYFTKTNSGLIVILNNLGAFGDKIVVFQNAIKQSARKNEVCLYFENQTKMGKAGFVSCFVVIAVLRYEVLPSRGHWECFAVTH